MENKKILRKLKRVELCMKTHPDCEKGSEFEDRIVDLQEIQQELNLRNFGKSFYCVDFDKSKGLVKRCKNQCTGCMVYTREFKR